MARYVPDVVSKRWVIISPQRLGRPSDESKKHHKPVCPFCENNETMTPPEVLRTGEGEKDKPGWEIRVVPNKFPITDIHEVIIHTPNHTHGIEDLSPSHLFNLFNTYKDRYNYYQKRGQVLIFSNRGFHAGPSLDHSHSQLVVIPSQINLDTLSEEPKNNIVFDKKNFIGYCPDFSQWPYELWIAPKVLGTVYGAITDEQMKELAHVFQWSVKKLHKIYKDSEITDKEFSYNYYIYPKENWYLRLIPRFMIRAGFELGTGLSVNIVDPQVAAEEFRKD